MAQLLGVSILPVVCNLRMLRLALPAMHALATLYAGLFMLLHQSGMEVGLPWHGIMSTWTCAASTLWRWLRSA